MSKPEKVEQHVTQEEEVDLKGTLISVLFVGAVILVMWLGVWSLFVSR